MPGTYLPAIWQALTKDRLEGYRATQGDHDWDLLARYVWNLELAESFYSSLNLLEVGLRNHVDRAATALYGPGWLADPLVIVLPRAQAEIAQVTADLTAAGGPAPTHSRLVAALDFGFWSNLFNNAYAPGPPGQLHPAAQKHLWPVMLPTLFPRMTRVKLAGRFHEIRRLRNRVFHHEPIWRGIPIRAQGAVVGSKGLDRQHADILEAIGWIAPDLRRTAILLDSFPQVFAAGPRSFRAVVELLDT